MSTETKPVYGLLFWIGTTLGWIAIGYGLLLLVGDPTEARWLNTTRLTVLGIIAHDILWLSVSVGTGWLLARVLGRSVPYWIRWAGWTSAVVIAMWFPLWRGYGDALRNDTILPRDYGTSIIILLSFIWVGGATCGVIGRHRSRRRNRQMSEVQPSAG